MKINKNTFLCLAIIGITAYVVMNTINDVTVSYYDQKGTKQEADLTGLITQLEELTKENQQLMNQLATIKQTINHAR